MNNQEAEEESLSGLEIQELKLAYASFEEGDYKQAIKHYRPVVKAHIENGDLSKLPINAVGNLCYAYFYDIGGYQMSGMFMEKVKQIEHQALKENPEKRFYHFLVANIITADKYIESGDFEFVISRTIDFFEPLDKNLCPETWFYAKKNLVEIVQNENIKNYKKSIQEVIHFLEKCENVVKNLYADEETKMDGGYAQMLVEITMVKEKYAKHID